MRFDRHSIQRPNAAFIFYTTSASGQLRVQPGPPLGRSDDSGQHKPHLQMATFQDIDNCFTEYV